MFSYAGCDFATSTVLRSGLPSAPAQTWPGVSLKAPKTFSSIACGRHFGMNWHAARRLLATALQTSHVPSRPAKPTTIRTSRVSLLPAFAILRACRDGQQREYRKSVPSFRTNHATCSSNGSFSNAQTLILTCPSAFLSFFCPRCTDEGLDPCVQNTGLSPGSDSRQHLALGLSSDANADYLSLASRNAHPDFFGYARPIHHLPVPTTKNIMRGCAMGGDDPGKQIPRARTCQ